MHIISRNSPCYYLTSVTKDRLRVFPLECNQNNYLRSSKRSATVRQIQFVCIRHHAGSLSRHYQFVFVSVQYASVHQRNYWAAHNQLLKGYENSLAKLRHESRPRRYSHSVWDHHPNAKLLWNENMLMERVNYTHQNPVRAGIAGRAEEYRWSSVRCWTKRMLDDEPPLMDIENSMEAKLAAVPPHSAVRLCLTGSGSTY